jgi:poly-gamma-glutamate capsule biosynthesis protein CapA/YwtB (metallophosphatase superfamily)
MAERAVRLFLAGDVMTGRGVDQALPHPGDPRIHEPALTSAAQYVALAERAHGPIRRPLAFADPWGDALAELARQAPDARIVNLETSVTRSDDFWPGKGINYRMHPANVPCLTAAGIDCCVLANNHVLDWGYAGLRETLDTLAAAGLRTAGAGRTLAEATAPAVLAVPGGRVLVFGLGSDTSGIPDAWAATATRPGVHLLPDLSDATAARIATMVQAAKRPGDVAIASIHWGSNWGFGVPARHVRFAHRLVEGGVDLVHGHSSHHVRALEAFRDRLILYGCGDLLDDYEGIAGYEEYHGDLAVMYFVQIECGSGRLSRLELVPMRIRGFRLQRADAAAARWVRDTIARESERFGAGVVLGPEQRLLLGREA